MSFSMNQRFRVLPIFLCLLLALTANQAFAQGRGRGAMKILEGEDQETAIDIHIGSVSRKLGLNEAKSKQLKTAYVKARKDFTQAARETLSEGITDNSLLMNSIFKIILKERKQLADTASEFLNDKQVKLVSETLGSFNLYWDNLAFELSKLKLPQETQNKAEDLLVEFVIRQSPDRDKGYQNGDLSLALKSMVNNKKLLDIGLKEVLPEVAFEKWTKETELKFGQNS